MQELAQSEKTVTRSRISNTPNGYIHLVAWSNACLLRVCVVKFTQSLPKSLYRLKAQLDDAARSVIANIEEGFARPTTSEYLTFLGYSEASLVEVKGDIQRSRQDNILDSIPGSSLISIEIDLQNWHEALKKSVISEPVKGIYGNLEELRTANQDEPEHIYTAVAKANEDPKGNYRNLKEFAPNHQANTISKPPIHSFTFLYPPVDNLQSQHLTYEIFLELINKTSWHVRRLVASLEDKLNRDQKFYKVERARIRGNITFHR